MSKVKVDGDRVYFLCPGCRVTHGISTAPGRWAFNGDVERPTISPSVLCTWPPLPRRCHSFVRDGRIEFLSDCTHALAGQSVELPEYSVFWPKADS
jgi:hypothetical protein